IKGTSTFTGLKRFLSCCSLFERSASRRRPLLSWGAAARGSPQEPENHKHAAQRCAQGNRPVDRREVEPEQHDPRGSACQSHGEGQQKAFAAAPEAVFLLSRHPDTVSADFPPPRRLCEDHYDE